MRKIITLLILAIALSATTGCDLVPLHMRHQPRYDPFEKSEMFDDNTAARPLDPNTVSQGEWGQIKLDESFYTGKINENDYVTEVPLAVERALLERGREQYDIYCAPCHSRIGDGQGMIVQRGFPRPPAFHTDRLRQQPDGYIYEVISNGFGVMYSYSARIQPADRWAIVAYLRALQLSQNAPLEAAPEEKQKALQPE